VQRLSVSFAGRGGILILILILILIMALPGGFLVFLYSSSGHFEFTFSSRRKHGLLINDSELIGRTAYTVTTYRGAIR